MGGRKEFKGAGDGPCGLADAVGGGLAYRSASAPEEIVRTSRADWPIGRT